LEGQIKAQGPNSDLPNNLIGSALLEKVRALAEFEHRPAGDILREAVALYRSQHPGLAEMVRPPSDRTRQTAPAAGVCTTIRDMIDYVRA
jgi:hypothetical protein